MELKDKAIFHKENEVIVLSNLDSYFSSESVGGIYIKGLYKEEASVYIIEALYSRDKVLKWGRVEIIRDGKNYLLDDAEIKTFMKNLASKNVPIIADVYGLDAIAFKEMLLDMSLENSRKIPEDRHNVEIEVFGINEKALSNALKEFLDIIKSQGIEIEYLNIKGEFRQFPFGEGGILCISVSLKGRALREFSKIFDFRSFLLTVFREVLSKKLDVVVNVTSLSVEIKN